MRENRSEIIDRQNPCMNRLTDIDAVAPPFSAAEEIGGDGARFLGFECKNVTHGPLASPTSLLSASLNRGNAL